MGLNQIAAFEGKVAAGNGEQILSRDVFRLGQLFDFFRMLSFFFTSVGYYFTTMVSIWSTSLLLLRCCCVAHLSVLAKDTRGQCDLQFDLLDKCSYV